MVNAMLMGYQVAEYPAVLHSRLHGVSKAKITRTILAHLRYQFDVLLRRLKLKPQVAPRTTPG
jgi:dolichol-phosphate mannosyltransferase